MEKRIDSVGKLLPHVSAKVVSSFDRSEILPINSRGELAVSGYHVMKGYWNDPVRTDEVLTKGVDGKMWMHTGDEAEMDEQGYVKITGRIKDLIIRGGENIHPLEIENCLFAHPLIKEVSVVGLPSERYGETVAAFVVPHAHVEVVSTSSANMQISRKDSAVSAKAEYGGKETEIKVKLTVEDVRGWVRERLSDHLVPKHVFWTDEYPKTASGKIQKFRLREEGIKLVADGKGG